MAISDTFRGLADDAKKLPVWAWPIIAGGVFLIYKHFQNSGTTTGTPAATAAGGALTDASLAGATTGSGNLGQYAGVGVGTANGQPSFTGNVLGTPAQSSSGPPAPYVGNVTPTTGNGALVPTVSNNGTPPNPGAMQANAGASGRPYTIRPGDTLSAIAQRNGLDEQTLFARNQATLDAAARSRGLGSSSSGWWIFPGTVIQL